MNTYLAGHIIDIQSYGNSSTMTIDGLRCNIIKLTYDITIQQNDGKTIVLKTNNIEDLRDNEYIHLMYNQEDHYILNVIENPDELLENLIKNKKIFNQKPSYFKILKKSIKSLYIPTLLPTSFIVAIIIAFNGGSYNLINISTGFLFYWFFFLSTLSFLLTMVQYPACYFSYSQSEVDQSYYKTFVDKYVKNSKFNKKEEIKYEYIQEK